MACLIPGEGALLSHKKGPKMKKNVLKTQISDTFGLSAILQCTDQRPTEKKDNISLNYSTFRLVLTASLAFDV